MSAVPRRFGPGDAVVGDYAWGAGTRLPRPVIHVSRFGLVLGVHREQGGWLIADTVRWEDVRGVIPAEVQHDPALAALVHAAADRVRAGFLSDERRAALADLLLIAATATLPTPVTAALHTAITTLTRTPPA